MGEYPLTPSIVKKLIIKVPRLQHWASRLPRFRSSLHSVYSCRRDASNRGHRRISQWCKRRRPWAQRHRWQSRCFHVKEERRDSHSVS